MKQPVVIPVNRRLKQKHFASRGGRELTYNGVIVYDPRVAWCQYTMPRLHNLKNLKARRRMLRRQPIPSEARLWMLLRNRQFRGLKFRRQHSIGRFIVDFYCPALRLVVEVDGESHYRIGRDWRDTSRDAWIENQGITIIRFSSQDVMHNIDGMIVQLHRAVDRIEKTFPHRSS